MTDREQKKDPFGRPLDTTPAKPLTPEQYMKSVAERNAEEKALDPDSDFEEDYAAALTTVEPDDDE